MRFFVLAGVLMLSAAAHPGEALLGKAAPEWAFDGWLNAKAMKLSELRGKVVLVRWWTAPGCRFCAASAPALNEFHEKYSKQGLHVIGAYHHKSSTPLAAGDVKERAAKFGFQFPVAVDPDWRTLKQWWLDGSPRKWTSVSFLIDHTGVIRHIHPGGEYVKGDADYRALDEHIQKLLREATSDRTSSTR